MKSSITIAIAAAAATGAVLAYLFDPTQGRRRRALVRDKAYSQMKTIQDCAPGIAKDLRNRAHGLVAETRRMLGRPERHQPVTDVTLPRA
jgi:hypothetical protein